MHETESNKYVVPGNNCVLARDSDSLSSTIQLDHDDIRHAEKSSCIKEKVPSGEFSNSSSSNNSLRQEKCLSRVESLLKKSEVALKLFKSSLAEAHDCTCSIPYPSDNLQSSPSTGDPVCFVSRHDLNLNYEYLDAKIVQWWKLDVNSILGKSFLQFYHPDDQPILVDFLAQIFDNCQGVSRQYRLEFHPTVSHYVQTQGVILWSNTSYEPVCLLCHHILCSSPDDMELVISESQNLMSRIPVFTSLFLPGCGSRARSTSPDEDAATAKEDRQSVTNEDSASVKLSKVGTVLFHLGELEDNLSGNVTDDLTKYKKSAVPVSDVSVSPQSSLLSKKRSTSSSFKSGSSGDFNIENINLDRELFADDAAWMDNQCFDLTKACQSDSSMSVESMKQTHSDSNMSVEENDTASIIAAANSDHAYSAKPRDINFKNRKIHSSNLISMVGSFGDDKQSSSRDPFLGVSQLTSTHNTESILVSLLGHGRNSQASNNRSTPAEKRNHVMHDSLVAEPLSTNNDLFTDGMGELFPSLAGTDLFPNALTSGMQANMTGTTSTLDAAQDRSSLLAKFLLSKEQFNPNRGSDYIFSDEKVSEKISQLQLGDEAQLAQTESSKLLMQLLTGELDGTTRVKYSTASRPRMSSNTQPMLVNLSSLDNSSGNHSDDFGNSFSEIDVLNTPTRPLERKSSNLSEIANATGDIADILREQSRQDELLVKEYSKDL